MEPDEQRNPIDGYRDVYPYKWAWSKEIAGRCISLLTPVKLFYDEADFWTYENHWNVPEHAGRTHPDHCVDIYWKDDGYERGQVPPPLGDQIADLLVSTLGDEVKVILWNEREWTRREGWQPWKGLQGGFVDHIHIEFLGHDH